MASVVAAVLLIITKQNNTKSPPVLPAYSCSIRCGYRFSHIVTAWAMQTVPASHGGVVLGVLPLATAVAAAIGF